VSLVLYHDVVETQRLAAGDDEVTFTLDPATIAGRLGGVECVVVDAATAAPIEGAQVMLNSKGQSGPGQASNAEGHVLFEAQMPGLYELRISAEGRASIRREVDVSRGRRTDLGRIALDAPVPIRGRADDVKGNGQAAELRVTAVPEPGKPLTGMDLEQFRTLPDGSFELTTLSPGVWMIQAQDLKDGRLSMLAAESMSPNVVVDTRAGPVENLCLRLERVSAVVARWTGPSPEDLRVRFFDEQEHWRQSGRFPGAAPARIDLLSGFWHMVVSDRQGNLVLERRFHLGADPVVLELGPDR